MVVNWVSKAEYQNRVLGLTWKSCQNLLIKILFLQKSTKTTEYYEWYTDTRYITCGCWKITKQLNLPMLPKTILSNRDNWRLPGGIRCWTPIPIQRYYTQIKITASNQFLLGFLELLMEHQRVRLAPDVETHSQLAFITTFPFFSSSRIDYHWRTFILETSHG